MSQASRKYRVTISYSNRTAHLHTGHDRSVACATHHQHFEVSQRRPVPPEDDMPEDDIAGGMDKFGMAPETEVAIEQELEDLNAEPLKIRLSSQTDSCGDDDGRDTYD